MKIRFIVDKKKLIFKGLNVEKRAIFTLQGLEQWSPTGGPRTGTGP